MEYFGLAYQSMAIEGSAIRIKFAHLGGGLTAMGGPLKWFQIAGADPNSSMPMPKSTATPS
ncbi:hypothetical protein SBA3_1760015 [Candidatus Sulfopaludibacter sp. SbA3]|nr:hypothetical protein SBA3_1760015 [Candidatus Sulfopaludibacter sp. SbA3]